MIDCNICNELNGDIASIPAEYVSIVKSKKNIILSSKDMVVLPSFGPLNTSHVMIVPREHVFNFSSLTQDGIRQLETLTTQLQDCFFNHYNERLVFFESGAGALANHSGGCIVHAHVHCVIQNEEFEQNLFNELDFKQLNDRASLDTKYGYIWYKSVDGQEYFINNPLLPSQFLRYLYMQSSSDPQSWNWRRNIDIGGIQSVIDKYRKVFI